MSKISKAKRVPRTPAAEAKSPGKSKTVKTPAGRARSAAARDHSKLSNMIALFQRPQGATLEQMMKATDWQAHSVRGAMSGALKKKRGLTIISTKTDKTRIYRIADGRPQ